MQYFRERDFRGTIYNWEKRTHLTKALSCLFLLGMMFLIPPIIRAEEKTESIRLWVFNNGKKEEPPDQVTLSFNNQTVRIQIQNEMFAVPSQILSAAEVTFSAGLGNSQIIAAISPASFKDVSLWMLHIADKSYGIDYDSAIPKGANIRKSCIISFMPNNWDGWFTFVRNCRTNRK